MKGTIQFVIGALIVLAIAVFIFFIGYTEGFHRAQIEFYRLPNLQYR